MAITVYRKTAIIDAGATALDSISYVGLLAGDLAFVTLGGYKFTYVLDDAIGGAESVPYKIAPNDVGGNAKRWILQGVNIPALKLNDVLVTAIAIELNNLAGVTAGVASASKALVLGANKNVDTLVIADSGLKLGSGAGTAITATAAELNKLAGTTITAAELTALHGITASAAEINTACDGDTAKNNHTHAMVNGSVTGDILAAISAGTTTTFISGLYGNGLVTTSPTKVAEYYIARKGTATIQFTVGGTNSPCGRLYINGSAVGSTQTGNGALTQNVTIPYAGSTIEVWVWDAVGGYLVSGGLSVTASDPLCLGGGMTTLGEIT